MWQSDFPIFHVTYSPTGGAGSIASAISKTQRELGYDSRMVFASSRSISQSPLAHPVISLAAVIDQFLLGRKDADLLSILRARVGSISKDLLRDAAVINLHWATGALTEKVANILAHEGVRVFWTLHDYRPVTKGCHYPMGCTGFKSGCNNCPQLRASFEKLLPIISPSHDKTRSKLTFVSPSVGLSSAASSSFLLNGAKVIHIPNPVKQNEGPTQAANFENPLRNYLFVASDVKDPRKGFDLVLEWWSSKGREGQTLRVVGANSEKLASNFPGIQPLGILTESSLREVFSRSEVLVFGSREDNAPGTVAEALANGLRVLCLDVNMAAWLKLDGVPLDLPGQEEITSHSSIHDAYVSERNDFLAKRDPIRVAQKYIAAYAISLTE